MPLIMENSRRNARLREDLRPRWPAYLRGDLKDLLLFRKFVAESRSKSWALNKGKFVSGRPVLEADDISNNSNEDESEATLSPPIASPLTQSRTSSQEESSQEIYAVPLPNINTINLNEFLFKEVISIEA